ncbi:hypothetical protein NDU88_005766 [Pleurodeles waltl]|uniref:Uncharacterized protein n=1 Tax=Pleurodeles waltl TaxID=8319 RepID=A0AAV7PHS1_PLEWA|nr:hypothetical protein NDU88_005766 [Pleurodeles waltl]
MVAISAVVPVSEDTAGPVAVLAAVSVAAVLAVVLVAVLASVLAAVHGSAPAEGHSRTFPAASDGYPLGKRLGTVAAAVDMPGAVQVAVQVAVLATVSAAAVSVAAVLAAVFRSAPAEGQSRTFPAASDGFQLGKMLGTVAEAVDVLGAVQVAVLAAVSVAAVLGAVSVAVVLAAVLVVVLGSAPAPGHSKMFPAASDGCTLGKMLGTVAEAVDVPGRCR